jgi:hypothetical protein
VYDAVIPDLARRYRDYLNKTDDLMDEPTVRIVERISTDLDRLLREATQLREDLPELSRVDQSVVDALGAKLATIDAWVDFRAPTPAGTDL